MYDQLSQKAQAVLAANDLGGTTKPAPRLYPHQWLWDSCFIAIGLRHSNPQRAAQEIQSLFRGQWKNGMLPNVIFSPQVDYHAGPDMWRSDRVPEAPDDVLTSCITQPPMVAHAAVLVGEKLDSAARKQFYEAIFPGLVKYHTWLYTDRDPKASGLVTLYHGWECGMDDAPHWSRSMGAAVPEHIRKLLNAQDDEALAELRPDYKHAPPEVRPGHADFFALYELQKRIQKHGYSLKRIAAEDPDVPLMQDVFYNAILIRANHYLQQIAKELGREIPAALQTAIDRAPQAFLDLYEDGGYWSRDFRSGQLLKYPGIAELAPLYSGVISQEHADQLSTKLMGENYWPQYGIATVPTDSPDYNERRFWQGPIWVNVNWLLTSGLETFGFAEIAHRLRESTLEMVRDSGGMYEYFSAKTAQGAGTDQFSWTAALTLDMIANLRG